MLGRGKRRGGWAAEEAAGLGVGYWGKAPREAASGLEVRGAGRAAREPTPGQPRRGERGRHPKGRGGGVARGRGRQGGGGEVAGLSQ